MKVKMMKNFKNILTVAEAEQAKSVIAICKDDEMSIEDYAKEALQEALKNDNDVVTDIYKASAEIALNARINDAYYDDTGKIDVWIEAVAETIEGIVKVGAYLTDIWQTGSVDYSDKMYVECYRRLPR